jgi:hypothetical protein
VFLSGLVVLVVRSVRRRDRRRAECGMTPDVPWLNRDEKYWIDDEEHIPLREDW